MKTESCIHSTIDSIEPFCEIQSLLLNKQDRCPRSSEGYYISGRSVPGLFKTGLKSQRIRDNLEMIRGWLTEKGECSLPRNLHLSTLCTYLLD